MSKSVQVVILCEDDQHENFARAYLKSRGRRLFRVVKSPDGQGSAAQFVITNFPRELEARRREPVNRSLAVLLDGDACGAGQRQRQLEQACAAQDVGKRQQQDRVGIFTPARNIDTWLRYLEGQTVDETTDYSPPGPHKPVSCKPHVEKLMQLCSTGTLPATAPAQLRAACAEVGPVL